jgi:hypothetical protein
MDETQDWVDWTRLSESTIIPPMTRTQLQFAKFLLQEEQAKQLSMIGGLDEIFYSVRRYVKSKNYIDKLKQKK